MQRAGNAERAHVWQIPAFCVNLAALAAALVARKPETASVDLAQPETFFRLSFLH